LTVIHAEIKQNKDNYHEPKPILKGRRTNQGSLNLKLDPQVNSVITSSSMSCRPTRATRKHIKTIVHVRLSQWQWANYYHHHSIDSKHQFFFFFASISSIQFITSSSHNITKITTSYQHHHIVDLGTGQA
jgi:hypothetical protein